MAITTLTGWVILAAPNASADPQSPLTRAVDAVRATAHCPALQSDPLIEHAAGLASQATSDYASHRESAVPFTDPMPALKTIGYNASRGLLLSGYGMTETDAIHGLILQGRKSIPDCSYTQYGTNTSRDDSGGYISSVILAAL